MHRLLLLGLVVVVVAMAGASGRVSAGGSDIFTVNTTADSLDELCDIADCSLRDALFEANANINPSVIQLYAGTFMSGGASPDHGTFEVDTIIEIRGASEDATETVIDGGGYETTLSVTPEGDLELRNLTVRGGMGASGGGIDSPAGGIASLNELTLDNVIVKDNQGEAAGGIFSLHLTMNNSQVMNNTSMSGVGGVAMLSGVITNTSITENTSTTSTAAGGLLTYGNVSLTDVRIGSNTATGSDGAGGWVSIGQSLTSGGFSEPTLVEAVRVKITDNLFITTDTSSSAGVSPAAGWSNGSEAIVTDLEMSGNIGDGSAAGGLAHWGNPEFVLNRGSITVNTAVEGPGAASFLGPSHLTNVTIANNESNSAAGALSILSGSITGSTIANNFTDQAPLAAAILATEDVTVRGTIIADNEPMNCLRIGNLFENVPTSLGYNIDSRQSCNFNAVGDMSDTDPELQALHDNGGDAGPTLRLQETSPAIDAWTTGCPPPSVDQRKIQRPNGSDCDIGAHEYQHFVEPHPETWGDINCANGVEGADAGLLLAYLSDVDENTVPQGGGLACPFIGQTISAQGYAAASTWGDVDCTTVITVLDVLRILYNAASLMNQNVADCPVVGDEVILE